MNKNINTKAILFDFGGCIDTNGIHWCEMIWMACEANNIEPAKFLNCKTIWLKGESWNDTYQTEHASADRIIHSINELQKTL